MIDCPSCGSENLEQARFCQACGQLMDQVKADTKRFTRAAEEEVRAAGKKTGRGGARATSDSGRAIRDSARGDHEDDAGDDGEHARSGDDLAALDEDEHDVFVKGIAASRRRRIGAAIALVVVACAVPIVLAATKPHPAPAPPAAPAPPPPVAHPAPVDAAAPVAAAPSTDAGSVAAAPDAAPPEALVPDEPSEFPERHHSIDDEPIAAPRAERKSTHEPRSRPSGTEEAGGPPAFSGRSGAGAAVRTVARQHEDESYDCFLSAFPDAPPRTRARVTLRFSLGADGRASSVSVTANSSHNEDLATCLTNRVGEWSFPPSASGDVTVTHTFSFSAR